MGVGLDARKAVLLQPNALAYDAVGGSIDLSEPVWTAGTYRVYLQVLSAAVLRPSLDLKVDQANSVTLRVPPGNLHGGSFDFTIGTGGTCHAPTIDVAPSDQAVCQGDTARLDVAAGGTPPQTYQWRKDGSPLSDGGNISGAGTLSLRISSFGAADAGSYDVVVTNACGSATSAPGVVTMGVGRASRNSRPPGQSAQAPRRRSRCRPPAARH